MWGVLVHDAPETGAGSDKVFVLFHRTLGMCV